MAFPKVAGEEETLAAVLSGKSIARYGDGELNNLEGKKCVPQLVVPGLAEELRKVIAAKDDRCLIGIPYVGPRMPEGKTRSWTHYLPRFEPYLRDKKKYYSAFISRPDSAPWIATPDYFEKVRSLWLGQEVALVWGGYRSLYPDFLRKSGAAKVHSVLCSYEDAYAQIDSLEQQVLATGAKRVVLCAGPTATCLAFRLAARDIHAVDLGHIALFWQYAGGEEAIKLSPVAVLPHVEVTKAQIKEHGKCSVRRPGTTLEIWWPDNCKNIEEATRAEVAVAGKVIGELNSPSTRGRVAVFVGAGAGLKLCGWTERFERIYAFEPDFGLFGSLRRNINLWGFKNVAFYKEAVGAKVGTTRMQPGKKTGQWVVDPAGPCSVMQTTLDAMELDALDCLIVDVGSMNAANEVLDGGMQTLNKFNPRIIVL